MSQSAADLLPVAHSTIAVDGVPLHFVQAGPADGRLLFLLHGFPEFWFGWREFIEPLAQAGFRVVAPDQRGYNLSGKPEGVDAYRLDRLADDIFDLADALGGQTFQVIGHDWGASVGWWMATRRPSRLRRIQRAPSCSLAPGDDGGPPTTEEEPICSDASPALAAGTADQSRGLFWPRESF